MEFKTNLVLSERLPNEYMCESWNTINTLMPNDGGTRRPVEEVWQRLRGQWLRCDPVSVRSSVHGQLIFPEPQLPLLKGKKKNTYFIGCCM